MFAQLRQQALRLRATLRHVRATLDPIRQALEVAVRAGTTPFWIAQATDSQRAGASITVRLPHVRGPSARHPAHRALQRRERRGA